MTDESYSRRWAAPSTQNQLAATISLPGSKSLNNRELVLSALAESPTTLRDTLVSRDSTLMIEALRKLGTQIDVSGTTVVVTPKPLFGPAAIDCGLAGTVMRFVPALASLAKGQIDFDGDLAARKRPMKTTIDSLRSLGVLVTGESLPFSIQGQGEVNGGAIEIDASASSQFVSGLLLVGAKFKNGLTVSHVGDHLPSMPHIEMTIDCLRKRGVDASQTGPASWRVEPGQISGGEVWIEPDLSNAGPFLAAAMVAGGSVTISNWPKKTTQVGNDFDGILQQMGASVERIGNDLVVTGTGTGTIQGVDIDLSTGGELTPVVAALAALAISPTQIRGVAHLRGHETDRLKALVSEINSLGGDATETEDGMIIKPAKLHGGTWRTYEDHRMATAGAIIGLAVPGVEIEDISVTAKTIPEFVSLWEQMLKGKA
jgi:3-phosphoshikimate 1-carboxyvinyltransferase